MRRKQSAWGLIITGMTMLIAGILIMSLPWILPTFTVWLMLTYLGYILSSVGGILVIVGIVLHIVRK